MNLIVIALFVAFASAAPSAEPNAASAIAAGIEGGAAAATAAAAASGGLPGSGPVQALHSVSAVAPSDSIPSPKAAVAASSSSAGASAAAPHHHHASEHHGEQHHHEGSSGSLVDVSAAVLKSAPHVAPVPVASGSSSESGLDRVAGGVSSEAGVVAPSVGVVGAGGAGGAGVHGGEHGPVAGIIAPSPKQLFFAQPILSASTAKLTPLPAPAIAYAAAPSILAPFPAWNGLAAAYPATYPATYSIEQHGYHITY